ncbi:hypothetical protein BGZ60DRAFT_532771 [Tricladium varicosporioides]|nr:hypothetical protein BGZ60DRAFT_532771 [Hymenoscyphus varicosporioides]
MQILQVSALPAIILALSVNADFYHPGCLLDWNPGKCEAGPWIKPSLCTTDGPYPTLVSRMSAAFPGTAVSSFCSEYIQPYVSKVITETPFPVPTEIYTYTAREGGISISTIVVTTTRTIDKRAIMTAAAEMKPPARFNEGAQKEKRVYSVPTELNDLAFAYLGSIACSCIITSPLPRYTITTTETKRYASTTYTTTHNGPVGFETVTVTATATRPRRT